MTPITHGLLGWCLSQKLEHRKDRIVITTASLLPDLDGVGAIISIDYYAKYHHVFGHNIFFGLLLSLLSYLYCGQKWLTFVLCFLSFNSHILGDLLGSGMGWGIPYLWPIFSHVYEFSPPFQWELNSWQNLVITIILIMVIFYIGVKKDRTIVEIFSQNKDKEIVNILKKWFGKSLR